jgi:hypothetical protein
MIVGEFYEVYGVQWFGAIGVWLSMGAPSRHNMPGLSRTMHVHIIDHYGIVLFWGHLCWILAVTRV